MILESPPQEHKFSADVDSKILELLDAPPPDNYNHRQIQLALEKSFLDFPEKILNRKMLDEMMTNWHTSPLSKSFRNIFQHPDFKTHHRFQGKLSQINLNDVEYFMENEMLPKI